MRSFLLAQVHGRVGRPAARRVGAARARGARGVPQPDASTSISSARSLQLTEAEAVRRALATLSEGEREAIELAYFGGHTYREVAVLLEQPEGTVKSRIRSGLLRLRAALIEAGVSE